MTCSPDRPCSRLVIFRSDKLGNDVATENGAGARADEAPCLKTQVYSLKENQKPDVIMV